ncbi:hypothetical protein M9H77_17088 [Catharanthus roseus]|uniref:Uncharacterized protein n=1 Tax=Catharanthus roseus TaxID=4058 RepID=A0ACC0B3K3_CATRO|nr:hypothetical protein M9H77_17088 [Catharanthus roseus]
MLQTRSCNKRDAIDSNLLTTTASYKCANIIEYCRRLVTQPTSSANNVKINYFVLELVNDNRQALFAADYLALKGIFPLVVKKIYILLSVIILRTSIEIVNIKKQFSPEDEERMRSAKHWSFNESVTFTLLLKTKITFTTYFKYKSYVKSHKHTEEINVWPPISPIQRNPREVVKNGVVHKCVHFIPRMVKLRCIFILSWNVDESGITVPVGYNKVKTKEAQLLWVEI